MYVYFLTTLGYLRISSAHKCHSKWLFNLLSMFTCRRITELLFIRSHHSVTANSFSVDIVLGMNFLPWFSRRIVINSSFDYLIKTMLHIDFDIYAICLERAYCATAGMDVEERRIAREHVKNNKSRRQIIIQEYSLIVFGTRSYQSTFFVWSSASRNY